MQAISNELRAQVAVELSTVVVVKNRCQFCYAFYKDTEKIVEHNERCEFRFSETFEAFDGQVKFACAVCFDVFETRAEHAKHEQRHKFPGGFPCSMCDDLFLNNLECVQHMETDHEAFEARRDGGYSACTCDDCGAFFQQESHLRLHMETNCGRHRIWHCIQCNLLTEVAYREHMDAHHKSIIKEEDIVIIAKVEDIHNEAETICRIGSENGTIHGSDADPLLLKLNEKICAENARSIDADGMDGLNEFSSTEISNKRGETTGGKGGDDERDRVSDNGNDSSSEQTSIQAKQEGNLKCKYCEKKYSSEAVFKKHLRAHGSDGSLVHKCICCYTYFKTKAARNEHVRVAHKHRVTCKICNKMFRNVDSLYSHKQFSHEKRVKRTISYVCAKCGASFTNKTYLDAHEKSDCGRSPSFKCDDCGKLFINKFSLKNHRIVHSNERKFACDKCDLRFKCKQTLKVHASTHSTEKPHKCQHCDKRFADASYLSTHMNLHADVKRYVCYGCGSRYPTNSALHKHRKARKDTCALVPMQPPLKMVES